MRFLLAVMLIGCSAPEESWGPPDETRASNDSETDYVNDYEGPAWRDTCALPAGEMYGVEIPVACYVGPPRHDDVEAVLDPYEEQSKTELPVILVIPNSK